MEKPAFIAREGIKGTRKPAVLKSTAGTRWLAAPFPISGFHVSNNVRNITMPIEADVGPFVTIVVNEIASDILHHANICCNNPFFHFCAAATACATPATFASKAIRKPAIRDCSSREGNGSVRLEKFS